MFLTYCMGVLSLVSRLFFFVVGWSSSTSSSLVHLKWRICIRIIYYLYYRIDQQLLFLLLFENTFHLATCLNSKLCLVECCWNFCMFVGEQPIRVSANVLKRSFQWLTQNCGLYQLYIDHFFATVSRKMITFFGARWRITTLIQHCA